jgi:hypothetical protein
MNTQRVGSSARAVLATLGLCAILTFPFAGCRSGGDGGEAAAEHPENPALRTLACPEGAASADANRAALARFVGVWNFEGWSSDGSAHVPATGRAAGVVENQHFVLLDLQATAGKVGQPPARKAGSMLLASEPDIGVTLTAWGDASPQIRRLVGRCEGKGSAFVLNEVRHGQDGRDLSMTIVFETDDRWTAEFRDTAMEGKPVVARYTFTRAPQ